MIVDRAPGCEKHLKVLEGAGLVEHRTIDTRNLYALVPSGLVVLEQFGHHPAFPLGKTAK